MKRTRRQRKDPGPTLQEAAQLAVEAELRRVLSKHREELADLQLRHRQQIGALTNLLHETKIDLEARASAIGRQILKLEAV